MGVGPAAQGKPGQEARMTKTRVTPLDACHAEGVSRHRGPEELARRRSE